MTETDISHMHGPYKVGMTPPCATWQDKAWQYIDKNGKQKRRDNTALRNASGHITPVR